MELPADGHNYIYFLQYNAKLPIGYFHLAEALGKYGITLLAIRPQDFLSIQDNKRRFVLSYCHDLQSQQAFLECKSKILDFAINSGNTIHMHFSTFGEFPPKVVSGLKRPGGQYHHYPLPVEVRKACKRIALVYYKEKSKRENWPGGKRPRLSLGNLTKNQ